MDIKMNFPHDVWLTLSVSWHFQGKLDRRGLNDQLLLPGFLSCGLRVRAALSVKLMKQQLQGLPLAQVLLRPDTQFFIIFLKIAPPPATPKCLSFSSTKAWILFCTSHHCLGIRSLAQWLQRVAALDDFWIKCPNWQGKCFTLRQVVFAYLRSQAT